jgi:hypothetical protein
VVRLVCLCRERLLRDLFTRAATETEEGEGRAR